MGTARRRARTAAGSLELTSNAHGLRYFAEVTPTSYAADLRNLMADGVVTGSSFAFTVAPGGETGRESGRLLDHAKRQVQPLRDVLRRLRDLVDPVVLGRPRITSRLPCARRNVSFSRVARCLRMNVRTAPSETDATTGLVPSSGSSSACIPIESCPDR